MAETLRTIISWGRYAEAFASLANRTVQGKAGAGIVADSDPVSEDQECANKAGALLVAVTAARRMGAGRRLSR